MEAEPLPQELIEITGARAAQDTIRQVDAYARLVGGDATEKRLLLAHALAAERIEPIARWSGDPAFVASERRRAGMAAIRYAESMWPSDGPHRVEDRRGGDA